MGLQSAARSGPDRHRQGRQKNSSAGAGGQIGLHVHPRPGHRQARVRRRRNAGRQERCPRRGELSHPADSGEASADFARQLHARTTSSPPPTPRRSTPKPARICGTTSAACTTAARSLRSRFTPRTPNPASSSPAPPAAQIGAARPPIPSSATFSSIRTTARWWVGWRRIRSTRPATKTASSRTRTPARKGSADSTRRCATPTAA